MTGDRIRVHEERIKELGYVEEAMKLLIEKGNRGGDLRRALLTAKAARLSAEIDLLREKLVIECVENTSKTPTSG